MDGTERIMSEEPVKTEVDEAFIRRGAEKISESDIQNVDEHSAEIEKRFLGGGPLGTFLEESFLALMLVKDYVMGDYRKIPYWAIAAIAFMFLYVLNPMDIIPDVVIGLGQIDDVAVVSVCLILVRQEIHGYREWRNSRVDSE